MLPSWLLPTAPPKFVGTILEHRINDKEDDFSDRQSGVVSRAMQDKESTAKKHAEWKALYALGWTPQQIADKYEVYASTVRRVTGGSQNRSGRKGRRIEIDGIIYESQVDAMKKLHISRDKLVMWIDQRRAKYLRG